MKNSGCLVWAVGLLCLLAWPQVTEGQLLLFDRKVELTGSFSAQASVYSTNNSFSRREPFSWRIYGNPRVKAGDFDIPMNIILGSYEDRLRQAYNKFGMSPKYKEIIVVHLGHSNVNFSPLVLGGKTILGAGFELNAKKFRAGFMYGRFDRAVQIDSLSFGLPTYKRSGYATKIGYGTRSNYIDLVFLKARDDEHSLENVPLNKPVAPAENAVIGLTVRQRILKNFHFRLDAALSAFSRDTRVREIEDPDIFIAKAMQVVIPIRISNQYLTGIRGSLEYRKQTYALGLEYDRIEPDFQSMGTWFIRNDIERISAFGRVRTLQNKLNISARAGFQRNNILNDRSFSNVQNIGNLDISFIPNNTWSYTLSYSSFLTRQTMELLGRDDSTMLDQNMHNISGSAAYRWNATQKRHTLSGLLSYQNNKDRAKETNQRVYSGFNTQLRYRIDITDIRVYVSPAFVFNYYQFAGANTTRYSPSLILGKSFFDQKMTAYFNSGISFSLLDGQRQKTVYRNIFNLSYKVMKKQTLSLRLSLMNNRGSATGAATVTEFQGDLIYSVAL